MLIGPAMLISAPVAVYGPMDASQQKARPAQTAADPCQSARLEPNVIVVCGKREGFRIDPDILKAQRQYRDRTRPKPPERLVDTSCRVVGTMGCMNAPTINVLTAAITAATMLKKAVNGENVGKMFITEPTPTEYELYQAAKREREEREALAGTPDNTQSTGQKEPEQ